MNYGYVRCSTLEQASEGRSTLEDQERVIKGVVMMKGEECVEVFRDPGVSGATPLEQRPEGARMLSLLKEGDMIIAAKLDRLFRSTIDALMTVESLKARGVGVILADISPEPVTAGGVGGLFFKILAAVADFERDRIKERVATGRKSKKARGGHIGGDAPYGYDRKGRGAMAVLTPNVYEQGVIDEMKRLFITNNSYNRTAIELNAKGMIGREGLWSATQVCRILVRTGAAHGPRKRNDIVLRKDF